MNWWNPDNFQDKLPFLKARMHIIARTQAFFDAQEFWAVETPVLQICPGMDAHIHGFKTPLRDMNLNHERDLYLHTSPEFSMKKLLVAGAEKIYQICPVFRDGEDTKLHSPEFTMIEWYRAGAEYTQIIDDCVALLRDIARAQDVKHYIRGSIQCNPFAEWEVLSVADAFKTYANIDLEAFLIADASVGDASIITHKFRECVREQGMRVASDDAWDDIFFRVMAEKIEPFLGMHVPCILTDYPTNMAALARRKSEDSRFAERFELYVCGVELANAFGELTDPKEQRARFIAEMSEKQKIYGEQYPLDEDFLSALEFGMPASSGIALGMDRLVMLATGAERIEQVLWAGKP